jgi:hypothetical protein
MKGTWHTLQKETVRPFFVTMGAEGFLNGRIPGNGPNGSDGEVVGPKEYPGAIPRYALRQMFTIGVCP